MSAEDDLADDGASNPACAAGTGAGCKAGTAEVFVICAQIEEEISELEDDEKEDVPGGSGTEGIRPGKTDQVQAISFLVCMSYLTAGEDETTSLDDQQRNQGTRRQPERSILILSVDSSGPKL